MANHQARFCFNLKILPHTDGRPRVSIGNDSYAQGEMTAAASGVAQNVATTLGSPPPAPHCPGTPGC